MKTKILKYKDIDYDCRIIKLKNEPSLIIAPYTLLEAISEDFGNNIYDCIIDKQVNYYADSDEMGLIDDELIRLIYN